MRNNDDTPSRYATGFMSAYFIGMFVVLTLATYHLWHTAEEIVPARLIVEVEDANATGALKNVADEELSEMVRMVPESVAAVMVMLVGGLGALLHSMRSFYFHLTKGDLKRRRFCKYVSRPFTGSILALLFYLVVRAGLSGNDFDTSESGLLFYLAMGGLAGMFSDQTVAKLKKIAEAIFTAPEREEDKPVDKPPANGGQDGEGEPEPPAEEPGADEGQGGNG